MTERHESDMSKLAWQSQAIDEPTVSLAFIHHHVAKLNAQFRREMYLVHWVVGLGIIISLVALLLAPEISAAWTHTTRLGVILAIAGLIYVVMQARRRGGQVALRPEESVLQSIHSYRTELQRRRDYYLGSWRWSFGPLLPSIAVLLIGGFWFDPRPQSGLRLGLLVAFAVIFVLLGLFDHRRKAKAFQEELDALDTL